MTADLTPDANAAASHTRRRRRWPWVLLAGFLAVLVVAVAAAGWYVTRLEKSLENLQREDSIPTGPRPAASADRSLNIVLIGADTRTGDVGRSDTLMVLHLDSARQYAHLVSIPRDLWVDVPGHGQAKINAAYAHGGAALTVRTLEGLLGARMDHTVTIDFPNFVRLTDTVGGITVVNRHASTYGQRFEKGPIDLDGESALLYVRERKDLPNGDFDRASRQRDVVRAILDKAASPEVLANPVRVDRLLSEASDSLVVDRGLTPEVIRGLADEARSSGAPSIVSMQAPVGGIGRSSDGQSIVRNDAAAMRELGTAMREDTMADYAARHPATQTGR